MSDAGSEILAWFRLRGFTAVFFSLSRISVLYSDFLEVFVLPMLCKARDDPREQFLCLCLTGRSPCLAVPHREKSQ